MAFARAKVLLLLLLLVALSEGQSCTYDQRLTPVGLCNVTNDKVTRNSTDSWQLDITHTHCHHYDNSSLFRVNATVVDATMDNPVVFVIRDGNNVESWSLPLELDSKQGRFDTTSRTICSKNLGDNLEQKPLLFIDVFTSSVSEIKYQFTIDPLDSLRLNATDTINFTIEATAPQFYYYSIPSHVDAVRVVASSNTTGGCAVVSVQNFTCPVNDLLRNAQSKGIYQTMTTDASLTVIANETITGREFFVVVVKAQSSVCHTRNTNSLLPSSRDNYEEAVKQSITLSIKEFKSARDNVAAIILPVALFIAIGILMCLVFATCRCRFQFQLFQCNKSCFKFQTKAYLDSDEEANDEALLMRSNKNSNYQSCGQSMSVQAKETKDELQESGVQRKLLQIPESTLTVKNLAETDSNMLGQQYNVYGWNTITVGIFYGLPAFQLVLAQQLVVNDSGNQDLCYYNFKCSRSLGVLSAFNNVWSNIGYFLLGITFICIVGIRHWKARLAMKHNKTFYESHGVPEFFGIYYAMGAALVLEGFMSAFYHICPSASNFQFDTAFMFIIGGLLIVKLFQARHPDIHSNAFVAFFCFAVVIFITLVGIYESTSLFWATRAVLFVVIMVGVIVFCISFYFYHDWRMSHWIELSTYRRIWAWFRSWCVCSSHKLSPRHKARFVKLTFCVVANIVIGLCLVLTEKGVPTVVLAVFVANFMIFMFCYILSKLYYKEPFTAMPILFLVLLTLSWGSSFYFYLSNVSQWETSPAKSREYNKECLVLDFYDNHDVWHFLSAVALLFSFLFLMTLDDGMKTKNREDIHIF